MGNDDAQQHAFRQALGAMRLVLSDLRVCVDMSMYNYMGTHMLLGFKFTKLEVTRRVRVMVRWHYSVVVEVQQGRNGMNETGSAFGNFRRFFIYHSVITFVTKQQSIRIAVKCLMVQMNV